MARSNTMELVASQAARALPSAPQALIDKMKAKSAPIGKSIPKITVTTPTKTSAKPALAATPKIKAQLAAAGDAALQRTTSPKQQLNTAPIVAGAPADPSEGQRSGLVPLFGLSPFTLAALAVVLYFAIRR